MANPWLESDQGERLFCRSSPIFSGTSLPPSCGEALVHLSDRQPFLARPADAASQQFFERLGLISLLGDTEVHSLITSAAKNLLSVHNAFNNFYNEPPFAGLLG